MGTHDYLPDEYSRVRFMIHMIQKRFEQCGFKQMSTPLFEQQDCFERSLGTTSEILQKEMYGFEDRRGRQYSLRPEITTGIVRSFIQHEMHTKMPLPLSVYYVGDCFRFERIKSNTQRSFWQVGVEVLGESDPAIDAELIALADQIFMDLGIRKRCELKVNTVGSFEDRRKYLEALENFYSGKERSLSPTSLEKIEQKKYLSLLTPLTEDEAILVEMAPKITEFLSPESQKFFEEMIEYLDSLGIAYTVDPYLFRPMEYYQHTVFEFFEKGTLNKLMAGGRYDGLISTMGGEKDLGGAGFAGGVKRMAELMQKCKQFPDLNEPLEVFVAATGPLAKKKALPLLYQLRQHGFHAVGNLGKTSMEEQLKRAERFKAPFSLLLGDLEVRKKKILVRNMKTGKKEEVDLDKIIEYLKDLLRSEL